MTYATDTLRTACTAQTFCVTPLGPLLLARTATGLAGAWFEGQRHHPPALAAPRVDDDPLLRQAAAQLQAYFEGAPSAFEVPLDLHGTPFQRAVWAELLAIGRGTTRSYADIARAVGCPVAMRAVGAAVGRNPLSIVVPCHRVVGSDGSLTGYAGGLERKLALLRLEAARIAAPRAVANRAAETALH
jgi:methylated-DNA-[protein]-cysteine S-methyltransferase